MIPRGAASALLPLVGAICLAGCGRQAELARPRPISGASVQLGAEAAARDEAARRARADGAARSDQRAPQSLDEIRQVRIRHGAPKSPAQPGSPENPATSSSSAPQ